jgi:hypothetical protein
MPTGKLGGEGKKLFESVYNSELKGKCKGDKGCAAQRAWGAVKNAGWKKDKEGNWTKKANLVEFSMYFEKAPFNQDTKEMSFVAAASDTEDDLYQDNMTMELFDSFLTRISNKEEVPEEFRSEFWSGGEPYVSVSHYPDLNGKAAPGMVDKSWVDGKFFKSRGHFFPTELGKAAYRSIWEDLKSPLRSDASDKVRISIAFLDYKHLHKRSGYIFERKSLNDICPKCLMEMLSGEHEGKAYLDGHLIHEALTRVPVNQRTAIEPELVERANMVTQKEDASSIVGEELAEFLSETDKEKLKSLALVTHSDTDPEVETEDDELDILIDETEPKDEWTVELAKTKKKDAKTDAEDQNEDEETETQDAEDASETDEQMPMDKKKKKPMKSEYAELRAAIVELSQKVSRPEPHPLDSAILALKSAYDETIRLDIDPDEKLRLIQEAYSTVGEQIIELVKPVEPEIASGEVEVSKMISEALKPIEQQMQLIVAQLSAYKPAIHQESVASTVPARRSIDPATLVGKLSANAVTNKGYSPAALARKSVGLPID